MIEIKQEYGDQWIACDTNEFWRNIGILQPILVETQQEFDYLWAMQLMIGREFVILLNGRDGDSNTYKGDLPPSIVRIML